MDLATVLVSHPARASAFPQVFHCAAAVRTLLRGTNAPKPEAGVFNTNLPEMPPFRTWAALRYAHKRGFAEIGGTGVGRQGLVDTDLHETPISGYGLLNVKLGLLWRKWTASIVVDNLLSRFYYEQY